jgi:hypothetical protein
MRGVFMNIWQRLRKEESGNVLYMTLILVLLLASFTMVTANVIYISVMKAKAQNTADQLALSAAALKARLLNRIANYNALYHVALYGGIINATTPYPEPVEAWFAQGGMIAMYFAVAGYEIPKYKSWLYQDRWLDRIGRENGLTEQNSRIGLYPVQMNITDPWGLLRLLGFIGQEPQLAAQAAPIKYLMPFVPSPVPLPFPITAIEPTYDWFVQSRVEWKTKKSVIGGKTLGIELPDIVTRARADLFDKGVSVPGLPSSVTHDWRVRLAKVDENVDQEIQRRMGSQNTGQAQPGAPGMPAMPAGWESWDQASAEQFETQMVDQMPAKQQYYYYKDKQTRTTLSLKEKVCYLEAKQQCVGLNIWEDMELNVSQARLKVQRSQQN